MYIYTYMYLAKFRAIEHTRKFPSLTIIILHKYLYYNNYSSLALVIERFDNTLPCAYAAIVYSYIPVCLLFLGFV